MTWRNDNYRHSLASRGILTTLEQEFEPMGKRLEPKSEYERRYLMPHLDDLSIFEDIYLSWSTETQRYFVPTTGCSGWDGMITNEDYYREKKGEVFDIVLMSPSNYLSLIRRGFTRKMKRIDADLYELKYDEGAIDDLYRIFGNGERVGMTSLDYRRDGFSQEGRHRAFVAKEMGIEQIPVFITWDEKDDIKELDELFRYVL